MRRERATDARPRPDEANDIVTAAHERAHRGPADGARRSENEDAARLRTSVQSSRRLDQCACGRFNRSPRSKERTFKCSRVLPRIAVKGTPVPAGPTAHNRR